MKIIYTTDLHGIEWKYDKLLDIALSEKVDAVVNGGNMLPKHGNLFGQGYFIADYLSEFLRKLSSAGIRHLQIRFMDK